MSARIDIKVPPDYVVQSVLVQAEPDECPACHHNQVPKYLDGSRVDSDHIDLVYQCTNADCRQVFVARYYQYVHSDTYWISSLAPKVPKKIAFPDEIQKISPDFCAIYTQADSAETDGLNLIAGCGYRKSLEFLIKDYLIGVEPEKTEDIRKANLGTCIEKWVADPRVKSSAKRATWLGNDETHYLRKWDTKDLKDLKILIQLTLNWIHSSILTEKYESDMP